MTKSLSKVVAALVLSCGFVTAQAANLGTLTSDASFGETVAKNQNDILSQVFKFTIDNGYVGSVKLDSIGSGLSFEYAFLDTKLQGGGWSRATDSVLSDGLFGSLAAGTYKLQFEFDSGNVGKNKRNFSGLIDVSAVPVVVTSVPEPESYAMFLAGLGILGAIARRRTQR